MKINDSKKQVIFKDYSKVHTKKVPAGCGDFFMGESVIKPPGVLFLQGFQGVVGVVAVRKLQAAARERFGAQAGIYQQFLFHGARTRQEER